MGLDISAYSGVRLERLSATYPMDIEDDEDYREGRKRWFWFHPEFPDAARGMPGNGIYTYDEERLCFSRPYSRYGHIRNDISIALLGVIDDTVWQNPERFRTSGVTFAGIVDLINFADNDGTIGHEACVSIHKALSHPQARSLFAARVAIMRDTLGSDRDLEGYDELTAAFAFAAENDGVVRFH